jgi:hypothetical protein
MAKKKSKASKGEEAPRSESAELLVRVRDRFKVMSEADHDNRTKALEDLRFANEPGAQWDDNMKKERGDRPCYEFNKCRINGKRVINEIRANRPSVKVRAVENGDKQAAELREGLIRNVFNTSDFDTVTDQAAEYQVDAGMGAWRIVTEYSDDTAFDQDIKIKPFKNPFCVYADPACQDVLKRDAEDWIITEKISKTAYESRWPKKEVIAFDAGEFDDNEQWEDDETVRICEYWYKEPYDKEIWLVQTPTGQKTVDMSTDEAAGVAEKVKAGEYQMLREPRKVRCHKIKMCIASGDAILEQAYWAGKMFPFVIVYGEYKVIDGRSHWWGLHRFAKDAQRSYNISRTAIDETIALAPQAKFWATPTQAKGNTGAWAEAHRKNFPFMLYNPDTQAPGPPTDKPGAQVPVALLQQAVVASQDLRDVTGLHEASFGEESDEKSGVALARKQNQAQIVTYNFPDNIAKGVLRTGEILLDLFPHIYDAEREMRIIGADGAEDYKKVNELVLSVDAQGMPTTVRVNDMAEGKYDVTVKVGPNFATQRQEAAEVYGELGAKNPALMQVAGDLVFKSLDYPYADEIAKRWQTILPPPIQKMLSEGKDLPPEAQAVMAQADQAMQLVQQQTQLVQQAAQEVQQDVSKSKEEKAKVEIAIAKLHEAEARFEANVAKVEAQFAQREAKLGMQSVQLDGAKIQLDGQAKQLQSEQQKTEAGASELSEAKQAVEQIDAYVAQFMEAFAAAMAQINAATAELRSKPKVKAVRMERVAGQPPRAVPEYEDPTPTVQ